MNIVRMSVVPKEPVINPLFTGHEITRQALLPDSKDFAVNIVNFGTGLRNKFHAHDTEQVLIVSSGKGIVATDEEETVVTVGDIILIPSGEKHWHGATDSSEFSHIVVTKKGSKLTQLEE